MCHDAKALLDTKGGTYGWHMAVQAIASQQEVLALEASEGLLRCVGASCFNEGLAIPGKVAEHGFEGGPRGVKFLVCLVPPLPKACTEQIIQAK